MEIFSIFDRPEFLEEVCILTEEEWGSYKSQDEFQFKVSKKIKKILANSNNKYYCKLLLLDGNKLVGFISLFENDGYRSDLKPWYATMYVKYEYRGYGYSRILNDAILDEAKHRGFDRVYLKSDLVNYYEKFGAKYMDSLSNGEKLYYIDL